WYRADVTVSFVLPGGSSNPQGCGDQSVSTDTPGVTFTCTVVVSGFPSCCILRITVKRDATPPSANGSAERAPDSNAWDNHAVGVNFSGTDNLSGIASCTSTSYGGPDNGSASVSGTCTDNAGNVSGAASFGFKYDGTAPNVNASAARAPDANGWYNHPVAVA